MRLFLIVLLLCLTTKAAPQTTVNNGHAQSETHQNSSTGHSITPAQWQQLTDDKAFSYKNDKEAGKPRQSYNPGFLQKIVRAFFDFFGSGAGRFLLWLVVICVAVYVILKLIFSKDSIFFRRNKKVMNEAGSLQQEDEDITATNWEALLQQATVNNDLRLAIRYSYMWLLQMLQKKELIKYRNNKTNYEYYTELNDTSFKQPFRQLSRQYEYAWYGRFTLSSPDYNEYMGLFNNLKQQLGS